MIPIPETPLDDVKFIDKWTHFVMYGGLTSIIWIEWMLERRRHPESKTSLLVFGVISPIIMGGLVELAQAYLTTCRSGDWYDFLSNSLGVILGCMVGGIIKKASR